MLAIRLKRTGRKSHSQFRVIVQDSRFSPKSGRVVAYLGNYDPHTKESNLNHDETAKYLKNGALPSERAAKIISGEGIKLPAHLKKIDPKIKSVKNTEKLRRNRTKDETEPAKTDEETSNSDSDTPIETEKTDAEPATEQASGTPEEETKSDN